MHRSCAHSWQDCFSFLAMYLQSPTTAHLRITTSPRGSTGGDGHTQNVLIGNCYTELDILFFQMSHIPNWIFNRSRYVNNNITDWHANSGVLEPKHTGHILKYPALSTQQLSLSGIAMCVDMDRPHIHSTPSFIHRVWHNGCFNLTEYIVEPWSQTRTRGLGLKT